MAPLKDHRDGLLLWFLSFFLLVWRSRISNSSSVVQITAAITAMVIMIFELNSIVLVKGDGFFFSSDNFSQD